MSPMMSPLRLVDVATLLVVVSRVVFSAEPPMRATRDVADRRHVVSPTRVTKGVARVALMSPTCN
jgi:hypothetical protein